MTDYLTNDTELTSIANAIRVKGGTSASLTYPSDFISAINAIETTPPVQDKTISPTEAKQTVFPDTGKLLSSVTVNAISSNYVGSNIPTRTSSNLSASGSVVTAQAGYYAAAASKAIAAGTATTPATTITANPAISVNTSTGVITATAASSKSITPTISAGYINSGTAGTVTVSGTTTSALSIQTGTTITPTETQQTAVAAGKFTTGDVKIGAISSTYIGSAIATHSAADLTASGSVVTVPSGYYAAQATKAIGAASVQVASTQFSPPIGTIAVNSATGKITVTRPTTYEDATVRVNTSGYIGGNVTTTSAITVSANSASLDLATQAAQTITPTTTNQTIAAGKYLTGTQTIKGDANLVAGNIAAGVSIFGVQGTHSGGIDTSDATLNSSAQMLDGVTAYAKGVKYTGNIPTKTASNLSASGSIVTVPSGYYASAVSTTIEEATFATQLELGGSNIGTISVSNSGLIHYSLGMSGNRQPIVASGYADKTTYVKINANASKDYQLDTQAAATITPTESEQTAVASGKYTTGIVKVAAISSNYVGSNIATHSSADLTASGSIVTAPAGYYASSAAKAVAAGSVYLANSTVNPTINIGGTVSNLTVSNIVLGSANISNVQINTNKFMNYYKTRPGLIYSFVYSSNNWHFADPLSGTIETDSVNISTYGITYSGTPITNDYIMFQYHVESLNISVNHSYIKTPTVTAGYISSAAAGTITVSSSASLALPSIGVTSYTPTESSQTISAGYFLVGNQTINAIPSNYVGSAIPTLGATTYTPTSSTQTIPSGVYLTGVQTIQPIPIAVDNHRLIVPEGYIGV